MIDYIREAMVLREYQADAVDRLRTELRAGRRRLVLQASTGAGKTVMASEIIGSAVAKGRSVLFVAHARELVKQCSDKLSRFCVPHGIIMRGEVPVDHHQVQVASKGTILSWIQRKKLDPPPADVIIVDECHRSLSTWWRHLIDLYPKAVLIGLTATPARGDGRGLGELYEGMVQAAPSSQLIREGYLVPTRVFAPYRPDLKGVKITRGDYAKNDLCLAMDKARLVGDIYLHWRQLAEDRPTIVFASGIDHSLHIRDLFIAKGVPAAHIDGGTDPEERDEALRMLANGDVQVLTNCDVLTEGVDIPIVSCCVLAKPTRSVVKYRQMAGRIQRPAPGKTDALLLDHSGAVYLHGFPDDDIEWTLDAKTNIRDAVAKQREAKGLAEPTVCKKCFCTYRGRGCPNCGTEAPSRRGKPVEVTEGTLTEVGRGKAHEASQEERQRFWNRCLAIAANKGRDFRMAYGMYAKQMGHTPASTLKNYPNKHQWRERVADVFPQYVKS